MRRSCTRRKVLRASALSSLLLISLCARAAGPTAGCVVIEKEGKVELARGPSGPWIAARTNDILQVGDRLRTGSRSRAALRWSELTVMRVNELTSMEIQPPGPPPDKNRLNLRSGAAYFFSREKRDQVQFRTPVASGAIRGTEFNLAVNEDGRTEVALLDGEVQLSNEHGATSLQSGELGRVEAGGAPTKTALVEAINIIQWCLYYPGVLDPNELDLSSQERQDLGASLEAYRAGELMQAQAQLPTEGAPMSEAARVYRAAALLSSGRVGDAESLLKQLSSGTPESRPARLARALQEMIAVVKKQPLPAPGKPATATEWLAESYRFQSEANLAEALGAARAAVAQDPSFGFGWARVAELEVGFGRLPAALKALDRSLALCPRNAQSHAVKGFILLAQNRTSAAQTAFDEAIALDGALGNAWLGRGLCQIRNGHAVDGRDDLQVASVLEPQRAALRSYLGKAFSNSRDNLGALRELALAERLDPNDPTAWLYSALVEQQQNEVNKAVRDLEKSKELNDNRRLFRSRLLLDEDQAVRSANLAHIYQDTGPYNWNQDLPVSDWSVREASRAVNYDYANFSAHEFLANSYNALRDPRQINLRYETPWFSELLLANLLSPVGAGNLSEFSAQQARSSLFERNHFGVISDTEYLSHGDWLQRGSQYGTVDSVTYAVDAEYRSERGWRVNNDLEQLNIGVKAKYQLTPQDSILLEGNYYDSSFGDTAQYYNQYGTIAGLPAPSPTFRGIERQEPNIFAGYHREWAPGSHTLFLFGHLDDTLRYSDPQTKIPFLVYRGGQVTSVRGGSFDVRYDRGFDAYSAELQQIYQTACQTFVAGGRYQMGWNDTFSQVDNHNNFPSLISRQDLETELERYNVYAYESIKPLRTLELTAGVTYDHVRYPRDIDTSPLNPEETSTDQVSPKAGIIWSPAAETHLRFAYTRSLGGLFYDTSVRLEPTQVAGFNQAFRSIVPESVVGLVPGTRFTTYGLGLDQALFSNTFFTIEGQILDSDADRTVGVVTNGFFLPIPNRPSSTRQSLEFTEKSLVVSLNQLLWDEWSVGGRYQLSRADLNDRFIDVPTAAATAINQDVNATMQQLTLYVNYYHRCGFFSQFQSVWTAQRSEGYTPALADADFWQFNLYAGYRFLRRSAEVKLGLLNLTDQDYLLNPVNLYFDLPRQRTLALSVKLYF